MAPYRTIQELPPSFRQLVELMQNINFGWIERLEIRDGKPILSPVPRIVRDHKLGARSGPTPQAALQNFALKETVRELIDTIVALRDGVIERVEVQHGLPFRILVPFSQAS